MTRHHPEGPANRLQAKSLLQEAEYSSKRTGTDDGARQDRAFVRRQRNIVICQTPLPHRSPELKKGAHLTWCLAKSSGVNLPAFT
jgi:hypothetical protein